MCQFHRGTYVHVKEEEQTKLEDINEEDPIPASTTDSVGVDNKVCAFSKHADSNAKNQEGGRHPNLGDIGQEGQVTIQASTWQIPLKNNQR